MAEAKNPTVDDLEKKEQELFRTGPLSVLTTSVKSNSQVLINCRWYYFILSYLLVAKRPQVPLCSMLPHTCLLHAGVPVLEALELGFILATSQNHYQNTRICLPFLAQMWVGHWSITGTTGSFWPASRLSTDIAT
jgi:hypothetical protein